MKKIFFALLAGLFLIVNNASAQVMSTLYKTVDYGQGEEIGTVVFIDTDEGLNVRYDLSGLEPGEHGFHVHEKGNCSSQEQNDKMVHAAAAGGHYDPNNTGKHLGPDGDGHRGDLPKLIVDSEGTAVGNFTFGKEKGLKAEEYKGRSLMVHEGGDNYSDTPTALGGGGARVACGIIE